MLDTVRVGTEELLSRRLPADTEGRRDLRPACAHRDQIRDERALPFREPTLLENDSY